MAAHAKFSASKSKMWMSCSASLAGEDSKPSKSSDFANEGTFAHQVLEWSLQQLDSTVIDVLDGCLAKPDVKVNEDWDLKEMVDYISRCREYVLNLIDEMGEGTIMMLEERMDYSHIAPDGFGTGDILLISPKGWYHIVDLKYGKGVPVYPEENSQLALYGSGARNMFGKKYPMKKLSLHIIQPRLDVYEEWTATKGWLDWFEGEVVEAINIIQTAPSFNPGEEQCRWCPKKTTCPGLYEKGCEDAMMLFENLDNCPSKPKDQKMAVGEVIPTLTVKERDRILEFAPLIKALLSSIEEEVYTEAEEGNNDNFKLVSGRTTRTLTTSAISKLEEADFVQTRKPATLSALEKKYGKDAVNKMCDKIVGKPKLVPMSAPGEPITKDDGLNDLDDLD